MEWSLQIAMSVRNGIDYLVLLGKGRGGGGGRGLKVKMGCFQPSSLLGDTIKGWILCFRFLKKKRSWGNISNHFYQVMATELWPMFVVGSYQQV